VSTNLEERNLIMDGKTLGILALAGFGLFALNNQQQADGNAALTPAQDVTADDAGLSGLGAVQSYYTPSQWYDAGQYVKIFIPFQTRAVPVGSNTMQSQFLYGGRWYTMQNLFRVWNPIRSLPSWMR
jgi:hypothetical protein